jgi:large subunit ribosomal protein L25
VAALSVQKREGKGKYKAFDLRKQGFIPGVVYGKGMKENINITINLKDFAALLNAGERILELDVAGSPMNVLIKAVQHGTYDHEILHADFRAISADEKIEVQVEIELKGDAPGLAAGGMLEQNLHHVTARCLPKDLPESVVVDVSKMEMGDIIYAENLPALPGVEYMIHGNPAVVSCHHPKGEEEAAEATGEEGPAVPEVIGEKEREAKEKE